MEEVRRLALALGLAALGLTACGGVPPAHDVQPWVGRPAADLAREWGVPTRELTDAGQRILVYEEMVQTRTKDLTQDTSRKNVGAGPPPPGTIGYSAYARSYLFWVDASGKITQTQVREP
jgi:hypothetical protein